VRSVRTLSVGVLCRSDDEFHTVLNLKQEHIYLKQRKHQANILNPCPSEVRSSKHYLVDYGTVRRTSLGAMDVSEHNNCSVPLHFGSRQTRNKLALPKC
jgi:hypothetical protein